MNFRRRLGNTWQKALSKKREKKKKGRKEQKDGRRKGGRERREGKEKMKWSSFVGKKDGRKRKKGI